MLNTLFSRRVFLNSHDQLFYDKITRITNLSIKNLTLYKIAFQHKSNSLDHFSNERLEFLGDAALSLIIGDYLFRKYPLQDEGFLTDIRSRIVNRESLGLVAKKMGLNLLLQYDNSNGRSKYIYGNTLEALVGAVCLDRGYNKCYQFVMQQLIHKYMDLEHIIANDTNYKSSILEWGSKNHKTISFETTTKSEIDEQKIFQTQIFIDSIPICIGDGKNKKHSEQNAARKTLAKINPN